MSKRIRCSSQGVTLILIVCACLCACSTRVKRSEPTLTALQSGDVFIKQMSGTTDFESYKLTYLAGVPPDAAWAATGEIGSWLESANIITKVTTVDVEEPQGELTNRSYFVEWANGVIQTLQVRWDKRRRLIDISVDQGSLERGLLGRCTIHFDQFRRDDTLVEAEIRIAKRLQNQLFDLLTLPIGLLEQGARRSEMENVWYQLAISHRKTSEKYVVTEASPTGRTHIIAIGVNGSERDESWNTLQYAEEDARAFFEWAIDLYGMPTVEDSLLRELLIGKEATHERVIDLLNQMAIRDELGPVQDGDMVLFYFAGHVDRERDLLKPGGRNDSDQYAYLVTSNALSDNLRATAVKRDDVLQALRMSGASPCVFFCDGCYSGGNRVGQGSDTLKISVRTRDRRPLDENFINVDPLPRGRGIGGLSTDNTAIYAAAQEFSVAIESDELEHGVFTFALLQGLRGAADEDGNADISMFELATYVRRMISDLTDSHQRPYFYLPEKFKDIGGLWPAERQD